MSIFGRLLGKHDKAEDQPPRKPEQAVLVLLEGTGLPEKVSEQSDITTVADGLKAVIERDGLGTFGGNEFGPTETTLFMYGPDAERLFAGIEPTLRGSPLCRGARVVIRRGGAGADQREVKI